MSGYHRIAIFLNHSVPQFRATRCTNLALPTAAILDQRTLAISVLVRLGSSSYPECTTKMARQLRCVIRQNAGSRPPEGASSYSQAAPVG